MECGICYTSAKDFIACPCGFQSCFECFQTQNQASCASCKKTQEIDGARPKFAKILRCILEKQQLEDDKINGLPQTQKWLDYTLECEAIRKQLRQGIRKKLPEKPSLEFSSKLTTMKQFSCPSETCRGFVSHTATGLQCGACSKYICNQCREILSTGHVCKKETLETLASLNKDSKECPTCGVRIFRTEGCSHMFCTHCGNHFDWNSGTSLKSSQSTNAHQKKTQAWSKLSHSNCDDNLLQDSVPDIAFQAQSETPLQRYLQKDSLVIRHLYKTRQQQRLSKHIEDLMALRVKYLRNQIDEATFASKLFVLNEAQRQKDSEALLLESLLGLLKDLQVFLKDSSQHNAMHLAEAFLKEYTDTCKSHKFTFQFTNQDLCFLVS